MNDNMENADYSSSVFQNVDEKISIVPGSTRTYTMQGGRKVNVRHVRQLQESEVGPTNPMNDNVEGL